MGNYNIFKNTKIKNHRNISKLFLGNIILFISIILGVNSLNIDPETGAYNDLVVAISETALNEDATMEERQKMISDIEVLLQETSNAMFESTGRLYLNDVFILVPRLWNFSYIEAPEQQFRFSGADIRVDNANPLLGDLPYTHQPHPCGVQGRYIHVTPDFVAGVEDVIERTGPAGRAMMHEWAQFRWGVREEYGYPGDPRYPYFHLDPQGNWIPTGSNSSDVFTGILQTISGDDCIFADDGEPNFECRFFPDLNTSSSLLHFHHLDTPLKFSTLEDNDRLSPNKQAAVCDLRSSWEVISAHPDMSTLKSKLMSNRETPEIVNVILGQPALASTAALYVVLDRSASNDAVLTEEIFSVVSNELASFFEDFSENARVALYTYEGLADTYKFTEIVPLSPLKESRDEILTALENLESDTFTKRNVYKALVDVAQIAKVVGEGERGVVFFTENGRGSENELNAIADLQDANLAVVAVGYLSSGNAPNLFTVCTRTGGRAYILDRPFATGFQQAINFAGLGDDPSTQLYQVALDVVQLEPNVNFKAMVYIEEGLGRDTIFALDDLTFTPSIINPDGEEIILEENPDCELTSSSVPFYVCSFSNAKSGEWIVQYTCPVETECKAEKVSYTITSYLRYSPDPTWPILNVWTSGDKGVVDLSQEELIVYVELRAQYLPLVNATVTAILEDPSVTTKTEIELLRDDGKEPDIVAGDGLYVAKMRPISSNPMFISIHVSTDEQTPTIVIPRGRNWGILPVDQASWCCGSEVPEMEGMKYRMERTLNKTLIVAVDNFDQYEMAPQVVEDLKITKVNIENDDTVIVNLIWTAPFSRDGKDRVVAYELYVSPDANTILDNIEAATLVSNDNVVSGELEPLPGGGIQEVGVQIKIEKDYDGPLFFRIRSISDNQIKARLSRVAYINIKTAIENNPSGPNGPNGDNSITQEAWFIALMSVLGLLLVVVLIGSTWYVRRRRHARVMAHRSPPTSLKDEVIETGFRNPVHDMEGRRASSEQTTDL